MEKGPTTRHLLLYDVIFSVFPLACMLNALVTHIPYTYTYISFRGVPLFLEEIEENCSHCDLNRRHFYFQHSSEYTQIRLRGVIVICSFSLFTVMYIAEGNNPSLRNPQIKIRNLYSFQDVME